VDSPVVLVAVSSTSQIMTTSRRSVWPASLKSTLVLTNGRSAHSLALIGVVEIRMRVTRPGDHCAPTRRVPADRSVPSVPGSQHVRRGWVQAPNRP
jgi:hypothetical protein